MYSETKDLVGIFSKSPVFSGLSEEAILTLTSSYGKVRSLKKGEELTDYSKMLGLVLSGSLQVVNFSGTLLNRLLPGSLFGVSTVFTEFTSHVTDIFAETKSEIYLLTEDELAQLFQKEPLIFRSYVAFLTDRIRFLNQKIDLFSAGSAEQKLMTYIKHNLQVDSEGQQFLQIGSMSQLASILGMGRASLYRAVDTLKAEGIISKAEGKKWIITNKKKEG